MSDEATTTATDEKPFVPTPAGWTPEQMERIPSALRDPVERLVRYHNENGLRPRFVNAIGGRRQGVVIAVLDERGERTTVNEQLGERLQPGTFGLNAAADQDENTFALSIPSAEGEAPTEIATNTDEPRARRRRPSEG